MWNFFYKTCEQIPYNTSKYCSLYNEVFEYSSIYYTNPFKNKGWCYLVYPDGLSSLYFSKIILDISRYTDDEKVIALPTPDIRKDKVFFVCNNKINYKKFYNAISDKGIFLNHYLFGDNCKWGLVQYSEDIVCIGAEQNVFDYMLDCLGGDTEINSNKINKSKGWYDDVDFEQLERIFHQKCQKGDGGIKF